MSTGRYQSRVFNFLSQQSLRLRDRSAQTWRQVKLAAVWGVQILLYPIYVGFQGARLIEKQFQQTTRQTLPRLRAAGRALQSAQPLDSTLPRADAPLQNVLQTLDPTALTDPTLQIRGIASRLDTGSLVLVTTQNQLLDLSVEQQTELTRRMAWETANYWRQRRLFESPQQPPLVSTFLPPVKAQPNALLPIRVLQKVMAWMQRGSVAVSADLFQESRLVVYLPSQPALPEAVDETALRSAQPSWVAMEAQFYNWLEQAGQATTDLLLSGLKSGQVTFSDIVSRFIERQQQQAQPPQIDQHLNQHQSVTPQLSTSSSKGLQLPAAANWLPRLDRWLSKVPGLAQPQLPDSSVPQPWLTMEDLFGQPNPSVSGNLPGTPGTSPPGTSTPETDTPEPSAPKQFGAAKQPPQPSRLSFNGWLRRSLGSILPEQFQSPPATVENPAVWETTDTAALETAIKITYMPPYPSQPPKSQAESRSKQASQTENLTQSQQIPTAIKRTVAAALTEFQDDQWLVTPRRIDPLDQAAPLSSMDTANQEEAAMLPQNWIEADAKLVEYVKHPLEQLLEWLDQAMFWIETRVAKIWHWLKRPIE